MNSIRETRTGSKDWPDLIEGETVDPPPPPPPPPPGRPHPISSTERRQHISSASMPAQRVYHNEATPLMKDARSASDSIDNPRARRLSDPTNNSVFGSDYFHLSTRSDEDDNTILNPFVVRHWFPDAYETTFLQRRDAHQQLTKRSLKRRVFLFLTDPTASLGSALFFIVVAVAIFAMNIVMIMQTMDRWQYTPDDCITCGGEKVYTFEDDATIEMAHEQGVPCVCPPTPFEWTDHVLKYLIYFFTVEFVSRVLFFEPPALDNYTRRPSSDSLKLWFEHLTETGQILDALAIFPFYLESLDNTNGLMSLRLLRLFRVFQLLRLGQYNKTFSSLTNVLWQSTMYLKLLVVVLVFGAALFGSLIFWLEKGTWQYHEESGMHRWMRLGVDGITEEPTPFTSIPAAFWWFMVTATTVGYGDVYPTTTAGKWVATIAMLTGVLVVAFPVSVFSDLWANEVQRQKREERMNYAPAAGSAIPADEEELEKNGNNNTTHRHTDSSTFFSTRADGVEALWSTLMSQNSNVSIAPDKVASLDTGDDEPPDTVTLQREDFQEIMNRLETIRENEAEIMRILRKSEYDSR